MSESKLEAKVVRVRFEAGKTGLYYATSPDLKGLVVARSSLVELPEAVTQAITDLYQACGERVLVSHANRDQTNDEETWVALPVEALRRALASDASQAV